MNKKKFGLILVWGSIILLSTFVTFLVIGLHSSLLVNKVFKIISIVLVIISCISLGIGIFLMIKNKRRRLFRKWKNILISILVGLYLIGCSTFLFLLYGPYDGFRSWLITTAMATMNHQHYCKWFYSDALIKEVLGSNYIDGFDEDTDANMVDFAKKVEYANEYERAVLEHDEDDIYKIIEFKVNGCDAYLAVVYDAKRITVGVTKWLGTSGQYAVDMAKENKAVLAINAGGFYDPGLNSKGAYPLGVTLSKGKVITNNEWGWGPSGGIIGFNKNNVLVLKKNNGAQDAVNAGLRDAVTMGPFLIINGKSAFIKGNGGYGYAARTVIGQREDGIVLMLVVDSNATRTKGASMVDVTKIMENYGAINAANLDGGTSSVMVVDGELINDPIDSALRHRTRGIPTVFLVK